MSTPVILRCRRAALVLLLAAAPAALAAQQPPVKQPRRPSIARADSVIKSPTLITTFSGGISLGAYQAGVDWALLEFYRAANRPGPFAERWRLPRFRFGAAAGASAGNINALLWAIETCSKQVRGQPPEQSLFWKVWTNIDVEGLLPDNPRDSAEFALLDRGFIDSLYDTIADRTRSGTLDPRCKRPIGITLTRVLPETLRLAGGIPFHSQRYVVPLVATVDTTPGASAATPDGPRMIFSRPDIRDARLGPVRHPPRGADGRTVALDQIFPVVKASSAFPVAFQPVMLTLERGDTVRAPEMFVDGGLFDNNPVDLALVLHRSVDVAADTAPSPWYQLLYVDPDNPRPGAIAPGCPRQPLGKEPRCGPPEPRSPLPGGLRPVLTLLGGAFNSAREYELFALSRSLPRDTSTRDTTVGWQLLTTRHHRVVGEQLSSFGAFLNRAYREHDFYVGAYDAIHFVLCEASGNKIQPRRDTALCTYQNALALRNALPLRGAAAHLIGELAQAEFEPDTGDAQQEIQRLLSGPRDTVQLTPAEAATAAVYSSIASALKDAASRREFTTSAPCTSSLAWSVACLDGTHRFLGMLRTGLLKVDGSACGNAGRVQDAEVVATLERYALCDLVRRQEDEYFQVYFDRVMRRLVQVERDVDAWAASHPDSAGAESRAPAGPPMQSVTEAVAFLYESTSLRPHVGWRWNDLPSEAPAAWRLVPAYLSLDAHWDGMDVAWEPIRYLRAHPGTGISFPFGVRWNNPGSHAPHWYYMAGVKLVARNPSAWLSVLTTRAETGFVVLQPAADLWEGRTGATLAHELNATILADRLRLGIRTSMLGPPVDGGERMQVTLGVNDVGGWIYWISTMAGR